MNTICSRETNKAVLDLGNREAQTEVAQFDRIAAPEGLERLKTLFLVTEDFDEGKLRTDQQVYLDAGAGAVLLGLQVLVTRFGSRRKNLSNQ